MKSNYQGNKLVELFNSVLKLIEVVAKEILLRSYESASSTPKTGSKTPKVSPLSKLPPDIQNFIIPKKSAQSLTATQTPTIEPSNYFIC